jgi:murein DD-endopeptidase MepM/ murein hydrolase activator NlpD
MSTSLRYASGFLALLLTIAPMPAFAQSTPAEIQAQIDDHNAQIAKLDQEIAQYQKQLDVTSAKKQTLQGQLDQLNLSIKKMNAQISATQNKIDSTKLQIQQLSGNIQTAQNSIDINTTGLGQSIRAMYQAEDVPLAAQVLGGNETDAWNDVVVSENVQTAVREHIAHLSDAKQEYTDTRAATVAKQADLVKEQNTLKTQQGSLSAQKSAQSDLLAQTKNQEATYQKIIAQKKLQESAFEDALTNLKSQLQYAVNPSTVTPAGKGILHWPVDHVIITQYFGNTPFASSGAYGGKGHNGIDIGVPIGTPVHAALTGIVLGTGNTDIAPGCYSFGKWVYIKHPNGLGTIYAHLSSIQVAAGEQVATGQLLGYSGETGYATGPHLHFGVYVASATQIIKLGQATNATTPCSGVVMPVPPVSGYLNPLNYLPAL